MVLQNPFEFVSHPNVTLDRNTDRKAMMHYYGHYVYNKKCTEGKRHNAKWTTHPAP
jgi:hypothetical protein